MRQCGRFLSQFHFFDRLLIDSLQSISKSVNQISDHCFKFHWVSVVSTDESNCVAKFSLVSVLHFRQIAMPKSRDAASRTSRLAARKVISEVEKNSGNGLSLRDMINDLILTSDNFDRSLLASLLDRLK